MLTDKTRIHLWYRSVGFPRFLSIRGARGSLAFNLALI
jgi:hypothetical protein